MKEIPNLLLKFNNSQLIVLSSHWSLDLFSFTSEIKDLNVIISCPFEAVVKESVHFVSDD